MDPAEVLDVANGLNGLQQCVQTHFWDLPTIRFVLLLIFAAAMYGLVNEMTAAGRAARQEPPPMPSR